MATKLIVPLVGLAFLAGIGGAIVLSVWDVQVPQQTAEKQLDAAALLNKGS